VKYFAGPTLRPSSRLRIFGLGTMSQPVPSPAAKGRATAGNPRSRHLIPVSRFSANARARKLSQPDPLHTFWLLWCNLQHQFDTSWQIGCHQLSTSDIDVGPTHDDHEKILKSPETPSIGCSRTVQPDPRSARPRAPGAAHGTRTLEPFGRTAPAHPRCRATHNPAQ